MAGKVKNKGKGKAEKEEVKPKLNFSFTATAPIETQSPASNEEEGKTKTLEELKAEHNAQFKQAEKNELPEETPKPGEKPEPTADDQEEIEEEETEGDEGKNDKVHTAESIESDIIGQEWVSEMLLKAANALGAKINAIIFNYVYKGKKKVRADDIELNADQLDDYTEMGDLAAAKIMKALPKWATALVIYEYTMFTNMDKAAKEIV